MDYAGGIFIYTTPHDPSIINRKGGKMKRKPDRKRLAVSILCIALCLTMGSTALADYSKDVPISFTVTHDMILAPTPTVTPNIPIASPTPTLTPIVITPQPTIKPDKDIVQTGDEAPVVATIVVIAVSLLVILIIYHYIKSKEGKPNV